MTFRPGVLCRAAAAVSAPRTSPHLMLVAGAALILVLDVVRHELPGRAYAVLLLQCGIALAVVALIRRPDRIRLLPLVAIAFAFHAAWVWLQLGAYSFSGRTDSVNVYRHEGKALLGGDYPRSEYPPGAVLLFALEAYLGRGHTLVTNALLMIPFQTMLVGALWAVRTRSSAWFAALVAIWPANAFLWTFRFDLAPTALLVVGLLAAWRGHWMVSGVLLGLGGALKWTPLLAVGVLVVWLVASRRRREAVTHGAAAVATFAALSVPFFVWEPGDAAAAYTRQGGRGITAESVYYLPLRLVGRGHLPAHLWYEMGAPRWADELAVALQVGLLCVIIGLAVSCRGRAPCAFALASSAPAAFLLANRIFSPQFLIPIFVCLALGAAFADFGAQSSWVAFGSVIAAATLANAFVFPFHLPHYSVTRPAAMAALFALALAALSWLLLCAAAASSAGTRSSTT